MVTSNSWFIFKIAEAFLELMVPLVMADIIDIGIKNNDKNYILMKGLVLVALALIGYLFALVLSILCFINFAKCWN